MLSVDDCIQIAREWSKWDGDPNLSAEMRETAEVMTRLLFELQCAKDESARYREELERWGIPAKRRTIRKLEKGGFEAGWDS